MSKKPTSAVVVPSPISTFSSTLNIPFEHPVTSLSISPLGNEAVLAAKRGLYIINLEKPFESPKILHHLSKWDVADCAWNPHISRQEWIVTTSNTKALIWNVHRESASSKSHVEFVLNKHLRAISDIHWSPFLPELVATCSYDAYVHLWDLRTSSEKPSMSFCGWNAGATQVKFNRVNEYLLALSHDTDVRIWDSRKGSSPITLITAHRTKIYGLDWSRSSEDELLTCSQDTLVKIWNIKTPRTCLFTIETSTPCWRARYTPFGHGILTMPQRKDNNLYLWNLDRPETPAYTFSGHVDTPTEFVWRFQGKDKTLPENDFFQEYQLVTWSKDLHLRLWPIGKEIAGSVGAVINEEDSPRVTEFPTSSPRNIKPKRNYSDTQLHGTLTGIELISQSASQGSSSLSRSRDSASDEESLIFENDLAEIEAELRSVQELFPSIYIDSTNLTVSRRCVIKLDTATNTSLKPVTKSFSFQATVFFPKGYPKVPLYCDLQRNWSISMMNRNFLARKLGIISSSFAKRNSPCLEFIVKYLLGGNSYSDSNDNLNKSSPSPSIPLVQKPGFIDKVGEDSDSDSEGLDEVLLPPKAFTADRDPTPPVDESDESFSDENIHAGAIGIGGLAMGRHLDSTALEKGGNSAPFPRLCSATFSPTGQLIYFFSPLPHPSNSKFTAYTLTTRNQQPILQSQNFTTQPKTYQLYESYRNFVLSKAPKTRYMGVSSNIPDLIPPKEVNTRDRKLDYWLDDEDMDDDSLSLYWRPKPSSIMQQQSLQTTDFLAKLISFRSSTSSNPNLAKARSESPALGSGSLKDNPMHVTLPSFAGNLIQNHGSSISISDSSAPTKEIGLPIKYPGIHHRRKSGSVVQDQQNSSWIDLGIPFRQKNSFSPNPTNLNSIEDSIPRVSIGYTEGRKSGHKKGRSEGEGSKNLVHSANLLLENNTDSIDNSYGTIVFSANLDFLCGPSLIAAQNYALVGISGKECCQHNRNVCSSMNRPDLVHFWKLAELVCNGISSIGFAVFENMFKLLADRKDNQTLATFLCIYSIECKVNTASPPKVLQHSFSPNFRSSSPALAAANEYLRVIPDPIANTFTQPQRKSRLSKSLLTPFTVVWNNRNASHKVDPVNHLAGLKSSKNTPIFRLLENYRPWIYSYSNYLYDCGLFEKRIQLLKATDTKPFAQSWLDCEKTTGYFSVPCSCSPTSPHCTICQKKALQCTFCRRSTKGLSIYCIKCRHGGHLKCMKKFFLDFPRFEGDVGPECLTGCGCVCIFSEAD